MAVQLVSFLSGALLHLTLIGILCYGLDMGFNGVILATAGVFVGRFFSTQIFIRFKHEFKWFDDVTLFSQETITNLRPLIDVSTSSMFLGIWGWWAFEIFTFMATYLG